MAYNQVNISSGHSINCQGMSDVINEVTEARKVVDRVYEIVKASGKAILLVHLRKIWLTLLTFTINIRTE